MRRPTALTIFLLSLIGNGTSCSVKSGTKFTAYGFPDANGVPAYQCNGNQIVLADSSHRTILGDGSYNNPYAAAAHGNSDFQKCELVYVPLLKKYFRVQDDCSGCVSNQLDLYIVQTNSDIGQSSCELSFGAFNYKDSTHEVIQDPGPSYEVSSQPLFANGHCFNTPSDGYVFETADGHITCNSYTSDSASSHLKVTVFKQAIVGLVMYLLQ